MTVRSFCDQTRASRTGDNSFVVDIDPSWNTWGPNGGYLTACLLRCATAAVEPLDLRIASVAVDFVRPSSVGPADVEVSVLASTPNARCLRVALAQRGRIRVTGTVWFVLDQDGLDHRFGVEAVPERVGLRSLRQILGREDLDLPWQANVDEYYVEPIDDWLNRDARDPSVECFFDFLGPACADDCACHAGRACVVADLSPYLAFLRRHPGVEWTHFSPTLRLGVTFTGNRSFSPQLFCRASVPWSVRGVLDGRAEVFDADGRLVATATQVNLLRSLASLDAADDRGSEQAAAQARRE